MRCPVLLPVLLLTASLLCTSCDILRSSRFEVVAWTPGPGSLCPPFTISLKFSQSPGRLSVEKAFSLSSDGERVSGTFSWDGNTVRFCPDVPLSGKADYRLSVGTGAEAEDGLSLEEAFLGLFTTRGEDREPALLSSCPEDGGHLPADREVLSLTFASVQDLSSLRSSVLLFPAVPGVWSLSDDGLQALFTPLSAWKEDDYCLTLPAGLPDAQGRPLSHEVSIHFSLGDDRIPPSLDAISALNQEGTLSPLTVDSLEDDVYTENSGWEATSRLVLSFSEEVNLPSVDGELSLTVVGDGERIGLVREGTALWGIKAVYRLLKRPVWGTHLTLLLASGVTDRAENRSTQASLCRIAADGPLSRPPEFLGLLFPLSLNRTTEPASFSVDEPYAGLCLDSGFCPDGMAVDLSFELCFRLAPGSCLDLFSLMERFSVLTTNSCLSIEVKALRASTLTWALPESWQGCERVEVLASLTDSAAQGLVTFRIGSLLRDSTGNETSSAVSLPLAK